MSLRESLERLASSHDLVFMPTSSRQEGKLVFSFGSVPVFIDPDKKIVYARRQGRRVPAREPRELVAAAAAVEAGVSK